MRNINICKKIVCSFLALVLFLTTVGCRKVGNTSDSSSQYTSYIETTDGETVTQNTTTSSSSSPTSSKPNSTSSTVSDTNNEQDEEIVGKPSVEVDFNNQDDSYHSDSSDPANMPLTTENSFSINALNLSGTVSSVFNNINLWDVGGKYYNPRVYEYNIYNFVDYVQFMQCTGGTYSRDLFENPYDKTVLDDYDFSKIIKNCRGLLKLGAKPHLKLGSVPLKYCSDYKYGAFKMNVYPPDDYKVYYNYIYALARALVDEFGREEVLTWRFGVMTEYENNDWFTHPSLNGNKTKIEFFKLYDYTVQALIDAIGKGVIVGAHSMSGIEGAWNEEEFIEHVAQGTNYANGGKGTHISYLSASFYQNIAGRNSGQQKPFLVIMDELQSTAKKYGLTNLFYGIDEGRFLCGPTKGSKDYQLDSRVVGHTYQAAFDARLYKQALDVGSVDYISSWTFLSGGNESGYPTVSYHVANNLAAFKGCRRAETIKTTTSSVDADIQAVSVYDEKTKTLRIMAYSYRNDLYYDESARLSFNINLPRQSGNVTIKKSYVNDDANYFDEWLEDREKYKITDDMFTWSPDDPTSLNKSPYELRGKYAEAAKLTPVTQKASINSGVLQLNDTIDGNSVVFYEIKLS